MIARHWKGIARPEMSGKYIDHLFGETIPGLKQLKGFINAVILKRNIESGIEFIVITYWESMEVIRGFAGNDISKAVVPAVAHSMMVRFDESVFHYEVVQQLL